MKVSVIIPVFNGARFVKDCIGSIRAQTFADIETVVVDDGSTDGLDKMADDLRRDGVRYVRTGNGGVSAARRRGIDEATGDWICFLDVDDTLPADAIEKYSSRFGSGADIIASGEPVLTLEEYKCGLMRRKSHPELWGKLFRADFIRRHYPALDRSVIIGEDQLINLVLANHATRLLTIPELLYRYNLDNPESVTRRFRHTADYEIRFEQFFDRLVQPGFRPETPALRCAVYKMKIEGFKMVVLDGNRFDSGCPEWRAVADHYRRHPGEAAASEKLLVRMEKWQWMYEMIMKAVILCFH